MNKNSCFSTSSSAFSIVSVQDFDHFNSCAVVSLCFFFSATQVGMWDLSSPTRDGTRAPRIGSMESYQWNTTEVPHCFLNLHFLMTNDVGHLSTCLFAICISSLASSLLKPLAHFKVTLFVFLLLSFKNSLYILNDSPLSHVSFANIFSLQASLWLVF